MRPLAALRTRGIGTVVVLARRAGVRARPGRGGGRRRAQARARPPPHARRVPAADLRRSAPRRPWPRRWPDDDDRAAGPPARRGLDHARARRGARPDRRVGVDDPPRSTARASSPTASAPSPCSGSLVGFAGPKLGWGRWTTHLMGALFAAILIPVFAGWTAYPGTSLWDAFHEVAPGHGQRVPRPRVARAPADQPGDPLHGRVRLDRVGDRRSSPRTRCSATAARWRRSWSSGSSCWSTWPSTPGPADLPHRVHGVRAVPAHRDARVRRARDLDPPPDRRPVHDLEPVPARRDRVHRGRADRLDVPDPARRVRARSRARGRASATS